MTRPLRPDEMFPAGSTDITQRFLTLSTGVRVRVAESGPVDGPPVVMLPGWGASVYMYRHGLDHLARAGCRVIAVDLRGFGLSDRPTEAGAYTIERYLDDMVALLDALGIERARLVGQSMAGGLVLRFALRHPERVEHMVLINPTGLIDLYFLPLLRFAPRALFLALGRRMVPRWMIRFILDYLAYGNPSAVTEQDVDEYWAPTQQPNYVYAARATLSEFDWRPVTDAEARSLTVPSLVLLGRRDRLVLNAEKDAARLAGAQVVHLPGGHCVHEELPAEAYARIAEFVAK